MYEEMKSLNKTEKQQIIGSEKSVVLDEERQNMKESKFSKTSRQIYAFISNLRHARYLVIRQYSFSLKVTLLWDYLCQKELDSTKLNQFHIS